MNPPRIKDAHTGNFIWCHGAIQLVDNYGNFIQIPLDTLFDIVRNYAKEQADKISTDENYLLLRAVGTGGIKYGAVVYDSIYLKDATEDKIKDVAANMLKDLKELEEKHPPVTYVNGLPIKK